MRPKKIMGTSIPEQPARKERKLGTGQEGCRTGADVGALIANIGIAARLQTASVRMVSELETQAANIGDVVKDVARIADQTDLLALNAAIEAARAGKQG